MPVHPMPDRGTYKCRGCEQEHAYLDRDWLTEVGFNPTEVGEIMTQQARQAEGICKKSRAWTHAERQAAYRARQKLKAEQFTAQEDALSEARHRVT